MIVVRNESTLVSDKNARFWSRTIAMQVESHVAPAWGLLPTPVVFLSSEDDVHRDMWVVYLFDDHMQAAERIQELETPGCFSQVFVRPLLEQQLPVSGALSHEVVEAVVDRSLARWVSGPSADGELWALEVCDPVREDYYTVSFYNQLVTVSDFVTPLWYYGNSAGLRLDFSGSLVQPFVPAESGFCWTVQGGGFAAVGTMPAEELMELPDGLRSRNQRRLALLA